MGITTQLGGQLPLVFLVGPYLGWGLLAIWAVQSGARAAQSLVFLGVWRGSGWGHAKL